MSSSFRNGQHEGVSMKRVTFSATALVLGVGLAGLSAPAAFAGQATSGQATSAQVASVQPADDWFEGGSYPTFNDCNQGGQQALRTGFAQYRCNPVYAPNGAIVYWQLWIKYP
jgi:hypothetical protein